MHICKQFTICFSVASAFLCVAHAKLLERPQNTEAVFGSRAKFICQTLDPYSVNWEHRAVGSSTTNDIYMSMAIVRPYDSRMSMRVNQTTGEYELTILSVQEQDAGRYECIDEAGHGKREGAELVVLVSPLVCQENIDPDGVLVDNDCGLEPDSIEFQCNLRYSGNLAPVLKWRKTGGDLITPKTVTIDRIEHQMTVSAMINPVLDMNGSSYTCETSLSKHNWTSSRVKLLYAFNTSVRHEINKPTRVNCSPNSSQPCQISWFDQNSDTNKLLVTEDSVIIDKTGSYHCVAECSIRGNTCKVLPTVVEYSEPESVVASGYQLQLPLRGSAASLATILAIFISVGVYLRCRYIERKRGRLNFSSKLLVTLFLRVQGIAAVGKNLYIIHRKHKAVSVYTSDYPYDLQKKIKREEFSDPKDIAAFKNCLHITDAGGKCVWKMALGLNPPKRLMELISGIGSPFTISISANGDIILAQNPSSIHVYNSQGTSLFTVQIQDGIQHIQHAIRTSACAFIVSHGSNEGEDHNITLVSSDGRTIKKYTGNCERQLGPLNQPSHIAISETGSVYVADVENDKIIVLKEDLSPIHAVQLHGSSQPTRLCYKDGQLLVGGKNGAVEFFGVDYLDRLKTVTQVSVPTEDATDTEESSLLPNQSAEN